MYCVERESSLEEFCHPLAAGEAHKSEDDVCVDGALNYIHMVASGMVNLYV